MTKNKRTVEQKLRFDEERSLYGIETAERLENLRRFVREHSHKAEKAKIDLDFHLKEKATLEQAIALIIRRGCI